ncbi:MAG: hypothetical protein GC201_07220 [Alphaproteobacteria bacterium]|nr:hypothetical protein [Alphaproteobacteria bacterium]
MNDRARSTRTAAGVIDDILRRLEQRILPALADEGARAELGHLARRLNALSGRIDQEGDIIWADIADQRLLLTAVEQEARRVDAAPWSDLAAAIEKELDRIWHTPAHYPALAVLQAENDRLGALIDQALSAVRTAPAMLGGPRADRLLRALQGYLRREAERKAPLVDPEPVPESQET